MDQMTESSRPFIRAGLFMNRIVNPIMRRIGAVPALTVRGRRSGRRMTVPLGAPLEFEGSRYLVSGRGATHWVRNLRAAGQGEFRIHGRTEPFRAIEVDGAQRERIVAAYRQKLGRSVDRYFVVIPDAADHPVFRMDMLQDVADASTPAGSAEPAEPSVDR